MSWLTAIQAAGSARPGFAPATFADAAAGRVYVETLSGGAITDAYELPGQTVGYVGAEAGAWYSGKKAQVYDTAGNQTSEFTVEDPNKRDIGGTLVILMIAAMAAAGALATTGGGAAGAAPGAAGSGSGASAAAGAWEADFVGTGALSGADAAAGAGAVDLSTITGGAAATGTASAGGASSLSSVLQSGAGLATKAAGALTALFGAGKANAATVGQSATGQPMYAIQAAPQSAGFNSDGLGLALLIGGAGLAAVILMKKG